MPPTKEQLPVEWVAEDIIRQHFNDGQYFSRAQSGEFNSYPIKDKHRDPPPTGEPNCTRSQIVIYRDLEGNAIALVHQYLRPDKTLGASGLPDPKYIILGDRILAVRQAPQDS
jgi:hypothetical protein